MVERKGGGVAMETEGETGLSESEIARGRRRTNPGDRRDQFTEPSGHFECDAWRIRNASSSRARRVNKRARRVVTYACGDCSNTSPRPPQNTAGPYLRMKKIRFLSHSTFWSRSLSFQLHFRSLQHARSWSLPCLAMLSFYLYSFPPSYTLPFGLEHLRLLQYILRRSSRSSESVTSPTG